MKISSLFPFLCICPAVLAGNLNYQFSGDSLQKLYAELHYLREVGIEIHQKYDVKKNPDQLRFCKGEYGFISTRAKSTIGIANRLTSPHKDEYIAAGWKAYECSQCTGNIEACDAVPPVLETIKAEFKEKQNATE